MSIMRQLTIDFGLIRSSLQVCLGKLSRGSLFQRVAALV